MSNHDFQNDIISKEEMLDAYKRIREGLVTGITTGSDRCTIILGGQPGSGKSTFYQMRDDLQNYVAINGDEFRRFHPHHDTIIKNDLENYAERTQPFSNKIVEVLIKDLGSKGYNLIIEGTLRNPNVPIRTCELLQSKGYKNDLVIVACDAEQAWKSTLLRAEHQKESGIVPRLVPIDIYNRTVHQIADSVALIEKKNCFDSITIINREGEVLYKDTDRFSDPAEVLQKELNLDNWETKFPMYERMFLEEKIKILEMELEQKEKSDIEKEQENDIEIGDDDFGYDDYEWDDFER